jgi:hypothetical protein
MLLHSENEMMCRNIFYERTAQLFDFKPSGTEKCFYKGVICTFTNDET